MALKLPNVAGHNCELVSMCCNLDGDPAELAEYLSDLSPTVIRPPDGPPAWFFGCIYRRRDVKHRLVVFARTHEGEPAYTHLTMEARQLMEGGDEVRYVGENGVYQYQREDLPQHQIESMLTQLAGKQSDKRTYMHAVFRFPSNRYEFVPTWAGATDPPDPEKGPVPLGMKVQIRDGLILEFDVEPSLEPYITLRLGLQSGVTIGPPALAESFKTLSYLAKTSVSKRKEASSYAE